MIRYFFTCLLLIFFSFNIHAQDNQDSLQLSLSEALEKGVNQNNQIKQNRLQIRSVDYQLQEARGNYWPSIDISASYTRNIKRPVFFLPEGEGPFGGGGVIEAGFDNSYMASATANMPLFNPQLNARIDVADQSVEVQKEGLEVQINETTTNIKKVYFDALLARESVTVLELSLENAQRNLENITNLYEQGIAPQFDVLRAEVELENIRPDLIQSENNLVVALNRLKLLLDIDMSQPMTLSGTLRRFYEQQSLEDLYDYYLRNNPNLEQVNAQKKLQKEQIDVEEAAYYPNFSLFGNYQYQSQANDFNISEYRWVNTSAAGIRLNIPIFSGFQRDAAIEQAQLELQRIKLQEDYVYQSLNMQAINAIEQIQQINQRIEAQRANIRRAERSYNIARASYQKGAATLNEVNDAELALTQARMNVIRAIHDYLVAMADYEQVTGKDLLKY